MVLSDKVANSNMAVLEELKMEEYKTKVFEKIINVFEKKVFKQNATKTKAKTKEKAKEIKRSVLVINDKKDDKTKYSGSSFSPKYFRA